MCVCVCVCVRGVLKESPTGGEEQAAANPIAHTTDDDWREEGGVKSKRE